MTSEDLRRAEELREAYRRITSELARFIVGQEDVIEQLVIGRASCRERVLYTV